jgi:HEPN domain-containing protein
LKTRPVDRGRYRIYLEKAERFLRIADVAVDRGEWDPALSAAIHAAISAVDAVCVQRLAARSAEENHEDATNLLRTASDLPASDLATLSKQFELLVGMKTLAEYEDRLVTGQDAKEGHKLASRIVAKVRAWIKLKSP